MSGERELVLQSQYTGHLQNTVGFSLVVVEFYDIRQVAPPTWLLWFQRCDIRCDQDNASEYRACLVLWGHVAINEPPPRMARTVV